MSTARPSSPDHGSRESVRRDAWRAQLLQEQVAEEMAARANAAKMRLAVAAGILLGLAGSVATNF